MCSVIVVTYTYARKLTYDIKYALLFVKASLDFSSSSGATNSWIQALELRIIGHMFFRCATVTDV